jgi:glycine cleavage system H protein
MPNAPVELKYAVTHEWAEKLSEIEIKIGITDHAQALLGDIVFVELPEIGQMVVAGEECGVIESVKAASDFYAPISGEVIAVNEALVDNPNLINEDAFHSGWIVQVKVSDMQDWEQLIDAQSYQDIVAEKA